MHFAQLKRKLKSFEEVCVPSEFVYYVLHCLCKIVYVSKFKFENSMEIMWFTFGVC